MAAIKDAALVFWKNNNYTIEVDKENYKLENVAFIEGTIKILNSMGLLNKMPILDYTDRSIESVDE